MEFRAEIKRTLTGPDKLRAVCSVILDDCFLVKNVRANYIHVRTQKTKCNFQN